MSKFRYAIEIGGSTTKIYVQDEGFALCEPTLVCAEPSPEGYQIVALGKEAKELMGKTGDSAEIFSPITNGKIVNYEYLKQLLVYFFEKLEFKKNKDAVLVLVNCALSQDDKEMFINLMYDIGFKDVELVPIVMCSLYGAGKNISSTKTNLIVNLGGANTDIAVVNMNSIIKGATLGLGGKAVDVAITNTIANNHGIAIGTATAEKLKIEVGSLYPNDTLNLEVTGIDGETKLPRSYIIGAEDLALVLKPFFDEIIRTVDVTITSLAPEISADIINTGVIFAGGMAKIHGLEYYLRKKFRYPFKIVDDAENISILGAGKLLDDEPLLKKILENT